MSRLPFDPAKMQGNAPIPPGRRGGGEGGDGGDAALTVSQLAARIDASVRTATPSSVRVAGEVSGFSDRTHWYFSLKDEEAVISCVMWGSVAKRAGFTPAHGQQVVCRGRVEFYTPGGRVSFVVEKIEPVGEGAREQALRRLIEEVRALGWLDPARKRVLPAMPRRLGVVTSIQGAAWQDVIATARKRCPGVSLLVLDVRVQGEAAAGEVAAGVRYMGTHAGSLGIDALLVTRGGGSAEDLWAFNDREIARAIVECPVPVVAAIGHETDTSLAELVADERAATPTQAAMRLIPDARSLARQVDSVLLRARSAGAGALRDSTRRAADARRALRAAHASLLSARRGDLARLAERLSHASPRAVHARTLARVEGSMARLHAGARRKSADPTPHDLLRRAERGVRTSLTTGRQRHIGALDRLEALSPLAVLERGYSLTTSTEGRVVTTPKDAPPGSVLVTRLREGSLTSIVSRDAMTPPAPQAPPPPRPGRTRRPRPDTGPGLFGP